MEHGGPLKGNGFKQGFQVLTMVLKPGGQRLLSPFGRLPRSVNSGQKTTKNIVYVNGLQDLAQRFNPVAIDRFHCIDNTQ
jgi:hypothetical protein